MKLPRCNFLMTALLALVPVRWRPKPLIAVGQDVDGTIKPIDELSYLPKFTHDSDCCTFLGRYTETARPCDYDLYWCDKPWPTVIARYSSDGPGYISGMIFADKGMFPLLVEAKRRAVERGLNCEMPWNRPNP